MPKTICILLLLLAALAVNGQGSKSAFGKDPNDQLSTLYKEAYDRKREIKLDGKKYRIYNNYVSFGIGKGYNTVWKQLFLVTAADFNFHIRKANFQVGGHLQGQDFYTRQQVQLHLGSGYRKESYQYFWAAYAGLSYSNGYFPYTVQGRSGKDSVIHPLMSEPGLYIAVQGFYKVRFDYGIGLSLFADVNKLQSMAGARIELFFSGAYRGTVVRKEED